MRTNTKSSPSPLLKNAQELLAKWRRERPYISAPLPLPIKNLICQLVNRECYPIADLVKALGISHGSLSAIARAVSAPTAVAQTKKQQPSAPADAIANQGAPPMLGIRVAPVYTAAKSQGAPPLPVTWRLEIEFGGAKFNLFQVVHSAEGGAR